MNGKRNSGMIRFGRAETAAAAVFLLLAALLFFCSGYAPVGEDECFYYATATGLLRGGRMFTDEWHLSQTSCLFQLLPLWLFRTATGGTEGLVLFMRRAFIAADLCIFIFLFAKLKKYSAVTAVLGSALLCADLFAGIFALNYYNMTLRFAVLAGVLLLPRDGETLPSARSAALAGVMTAFAVLSQPSMLLAYALYSVFVLIRTLAKKKNRALFGNYDFALNGKSWLLLSAAAACCAAALLAVVIIRSGARTLLENLPELLKNSEYVMTATGNIMNRMKPAMLIDAIGGLNAAALAVLPAIAGICKKAGAGKWVKLALTIAVQGFAVAAIVHGFDDMLNCVTYPITMYALTVYILCDRKDRRIFSLWILSAMCGFAVDYTSNATLFYGGRIAYIPAVYFTVRLIEELRQTGGRKKLPARLPAAVSLLLACALLLCVVVCAAAPAGVGVLSAGEPENGYSLLTSGPLRGIRASGAFVSQYENVLTDLDVIGEGDGPFYTAALFPYPYLYLDRPIGIYSSFYVESDSETRSLRYWELHPENRPEFIYLPTENYVADNRPAEPRDEDEINEKLDFFRSLGDCVITRGKAGVIIRIAQWYEIGGTS